MLGDTRVYEPQKRARLGTTGDHLTLRRDRTSGQGTMLGSAGHPGGNPGANLKSIFHICYPILVACVGELTKESISSPLGCLQGGGCWGGQEGDARGLIGGAGQAIVVKSL